MGRSVSGGEIPYFSGQSEPMNLGFSIRLFFLTGHAQIISTSVEQYCRRIEELFMEEMFPRPTEPYLQPQKQSAWLEKAKGALTSEKKIEPFNFTAEVCACRIAIKENVDESRHSSFSHASRSTTLKPLAHCSTKSITLLTRIGYLRSYRRKRA